MVRFSQIRYSRDAAASNPLARLIGILLGLVALGVSVFVGAIFIAGIVGLAILGAVFIAVRTWLLRRKMERYAKEHGDLEAEYTVIREDVRRTVRTRDEQ